MARTLTLVFLAASLPACQDPTQINLELSTDVLCSDLVETKLWARDLGEAQFDFERAVIDHRGPEPHCGADGRMGSIVAVPSADDDAAVGFEVVTRVGALTCDDPPAYGPGCIIARRGVRFLPQTSLDLPIRLTLDCLGVVCEATETCQAGVCIDAEVTSCAGEGCNLEPSPFVDPETLELSWSQAVAGGRILDLAPFGGRVIAAGELANSAEAMVAAYVDGGLEAWRTTFGNDGFTSATRIGVVDGRARVLGRFEGSLSLGGATLSAPGGGVFSATFGLDGQIADSSSFPASCLEGTFSTLAFGGEAIAVGGNCSGELALNGTTLPTPQVIAGFLGIVAPNAPDSLHLWPDTTVVDDVVFDPDGDVYVAGRASGAFTVGSEGGEGDVFIARLDPTGTEARWVRGFSTLPAGVGGAPRRAKLALGPRGLAYLGGHLNGFDTPAGPVHTVMGAELPQTFVLALSNDGEVIAAHSLVSEAGECAGRDVTFTPGGGIAIVAEVPPAKASQLDGSLVETATGLLLVRFDDDGEHLVIPIGEGTNTTVAGRLDAVSAGANGDLYVAGVSQGLLSVGGEPLEQGQGFLARYAP